MVTRLCAQNMRACKCTRTHTNYNACLWNSAYELVSTVRVRVHTNEYPFKRSNFHVLHKQRYKQICEKTIIHSDTFILLNHNACIATIWILLDWNINAGIRNKSMYGVTGIFARNRKCKKRKEKQIILHFLQVPPMAERFIIHFGNCEIHGHLLCTMVIRK